MIQESAFALLPGWSLANNCGNESPNAPRPPTRRNSRRVFIVMATLIERLLTLSNYLFNNPPMHVSQAEVTAIVTVGELFVIEAELMENCGV